MKKNVLLGLVILLCAVMATAQPGSHYSRVKIKLGEKTLADVGALGLENDHGEIAKGRYIINDYSEEEISKLDEAGFLYEVLIPDVQEWYASQSASVQNIGFRDGCGEDISYNYETPVNYEYGSMGGYQTYAEMLSTLDKMAEMYPNLISARQPIGDFETHENRPVYWLKVSDNPNQDEATEPEVLYTAVHHAREPNSLSQIIFYLWYLLENYEDDPEVQFLVDNTEMYFIPCINPDGYIYNETTNPNGGGLWRKNRWESNGEVYGVDLNRNYGFEWGADNNGSSPDPNSQVYRGETAFSEPETQAVKYFCEQHEFQIALNYHTHGNLLIHPWGYNDTPTAEDALFKGMGNVMIRENNFTMGTGTETVGYVVNGGSDDWMYGESDTKAPIYSYTPEVGPNSFGFWPPQTAIDELNKSAMWQNLSMALLVHNFTEAESVETGLIEASEGSGTLNVAKYGLAPGATTIEVTAASPNVAVEANAQTYELNTLESTTHSYNYTITPGTEVLEEVKFAILVDNGVYVRTDTITRSYLNSVPEQVVADDLTEANQWTTAGSWNITNSDFVSAPTSMADSPFGNYEDGTQNSITLQTPFGLEEGERAFLNYWAKWAIEEGWDYAQVMISTDGVNYTPLCGQYTRPGTGGFQPDGDPIYHGVQEDWVYEQIEISDYIGSEELYIRFELNSDNYINLDGFYFDDLEVSLLKEAIVNSDQVEVKPLQFMQAQPNPFQTGLSVDFVLNNTPKEVTVRLTTPVGELISHRTAGSILAGNRHRVQLPTAQLPSGFYLVQLYADGQLLATEKVVKSE